MKTTILTLTFFLALAFSRSLSAMPAETIKLVVYKRGESIGGESFLPANEAVVDYLLSLKRPTDVLKAIKYTCTAKGYWIRPSVNPWNVSGTQQYVDLRTVYEIRDCVEIP